MRLEAEKEDFIGATRAAVTDYVKGKYGTEPEFLWRKFPDFAVFRKKDNAKWYAVIMDVTRQKLGLDGQGKVDIIDVKCGYETKEIFKNFKGFLPAYHMNKEKWITVLLDGTVDLRLLSDLIDESYDLA